MPVPATQVPLPTRADVRFMAFNLPEALVWALMCAFAVLLCVVPMVTLGIPGHLSGMGAWGTALAFALASPWLVLMWVHERTAAPRNDHLGLLVWWLMAMTLVVCTAPVPTHGTRPQVHEAA